MFGTWGGGKYLMNFGDLENLKPLVACLHQFAYNTNELFIMHKKADFNISVTAALIQPSLILQ